MFCQRRHWLESTGKHDVFFCSGDITASSAFAASIMASVGAPSGRGANSSGMTSPPVVMPRNGPFSILSQFASRPCARGLFLVRASACARAVGPAILASGGSGMNG